MSEIEKIAQSATSPALAKKFKEGAKENMEHVSNPYFTVSIRGARFKIDNKEVGDRGLSFEAVIEQILPVNTYYKVKFDPSNPTPPDCTSIGGVKPDATVDEPQGEKCSSCKQNQFGTGTGPDGKPSKGKACSNAKRLVVKMQGIDLPVLIQLPPTSVKEFDQYLSELTAHDLPFYAVLSTFSFDSNVTYPKPLVDAKGCLSEKNFDEIVTHRKTDEVNAALYAFGVIEEKETEDAF